MIDLLFKAVDDLRVKKSKQDVFEATACIDYRNEGESSPLYTYPVVPNLAIALCNLVYNVD